ncbi:MAG: hypothetical protein J5784_02280 [Muribaculaceae bacterium]|nr:hypothetical protein [Muribaculaceae bacterium]
MSLKIVRQPDIPDEISRIIDDTAANGVPPTAEHIYDGKRNTLYRVGECNVKRFGRPNALNKFVYGIFRRSKARRSYEHALRLQSLGFDTPQPFGYIEKSHCGMFTDSYYFCRQLEGVETMRDWDSILDDRTLLTDFCRFSLSLWEKGVWHKDYSPGNILRDIDENGKNRFRLVDLNRIKFIKTGRKHLIAMFTKISIDRSVNEQICRCVAEVAGIDAEKFVADVRRNLEKYFAKKHRNKVLKRIFLNKTTR